MVLTKLLVVARWACRWWECGICITSVRYRRGAAGEKRHYYAAVYPDVDSVIQTLSPMVISYRSREKSIEWRGIKHCGQ